MMWLPMARSLSTACEVKVNARSRASTKFGLLKSPRVGCGGPLFALIR